MGTKRTAGEVVEQERVKYFHDDEDEECLAITVTGLNLDRDGILWIWVHKPKPIGPSLGYEYPSSGPAFDCTSGNSVRVGLAGDWVDEHDGRADVERVWIPLRVPNQDLSSVKYLFLRTANLAIRGWAV